MRLSHLISVVATVFMLTSVAIAEDAAPAAAESGDDLAWDQFDDPDFVPESTPDAEAPDAAQTEATNALAEAAPSEEAPSEQADTSDSINWEGDVAADETAGIAVEAGSEARVSGIVLGPEGVDDQGRKGRLHTVARGDTLWDLSAAYLGTPWVWPSVWIDNDDIENPHLIVPDDKIWITANEMRVVTDAEAESFLTPPIAEETVAAAFDDMAEMPVEVDVPPLAALEGEDDPSTLDAFPVAIPGVEPETMSMGRQITVARRESFGFVSADDLAGASTIVASSTERTFISTGDPVVIGIGEGDAEVGDKFMVFNVIEEVRDTETNRILGHHVENLGWVQVTELTGDTARAEIRQSYAEIRRGASIVAKEPVSRRVTTRTTPDAIEGEVVFLPSDRTLMADGGYVYLNRGEFHGVELGSELEVFDTGEIVNDRERRVDVRTPDQPIATLIVVTVEPDSSVAFVLNSTREIAIGNTVRPVMGKSLARR